MLSFQIDKVKKALNKYGDSMKNIAFTYTQNMEDARDIVQDVFLFIHQGKHCN